MYRKDIFGSLATWVAKAPTAAVQGLFGWGSRAARLRGAPACASRFSKVRSVRMRTVSGGWHQPGSLGLYELNSLL